MVKLSATTSIAGGDAAAAGAKGNDAKEGGSNLPCPETAGEAAEPKKGASAGIPKTHCWQLEPSTGAPLRARRGGARAEALTRARVLTALHKLGSMPPPLRPSTCTHTHAHAHARTRAHANAHAHAHAHAHARMHARTHTRASLCI